jgi:hypothetical protein
MGGMVIVEGDPELGEISLVFLVHPLDERLRRRRTRRCSAALAS